MCLNSEVDAADNEFIVATIPPTRPDVMHMADIVEDVAIAYGYDNIVKTQPKTNTTGEQVNIIAFCFLPNWLILISVYYYIFRNLSMIAYTIEIYKPKFANIKILEFD